MTTVPVRVAGEIVMKISDVPTEALEQIKSALTFNNEDREKKAREKVFGWWDEPETIVLWRIERRRGGDEVICIPRGFASHLVAGFQNMGIEFAWDDQRSLSPAQEGYFKIFTLRDYQLDACMRLLQAQQGFYKAPTGSGKTETALCTMAYANQRTLVVVDKASLVEQWRLRAARRFDMPIDVDDEGRETASFESQRSVGKIGEDVWEERDLTIALRQTLHSRRWQADATKWWSTWGACFPRGVLIDTPCGPAPIESLRPGDQVWGIEDGQPIATEVTKVFSREYAGPMNIVNGVLMTPNHPVWSSSRGWVWACGLGDSDRVLINATNPYRSEDGQTPGSRPDMRMVQASIQGPTTETILHSIVRREFLRRQAEQPIQGREWARVAGQGWPSGWQPLEGRQWSEDAVGSVHDVGSAGMGMRVRGQDERGQEALLLQPRLGRAGFEDRGRDRRAFSFICDGSAEGRDQTILARVTGMAGGSVAQPPDLQELRYGPLQGAAGHSLEVFNFETGTNNYLAAGLLVHNCWFDEGHHLAAETVQEIGRQCTSFYLHGTSATNAPSPTRGNIVHAIVGPVVAETPKELLFERGILVRPRVEIVRSDFKADFWDTHDSRVENGEVVCGMPGCKKSREGTKHMHRNNYSSVLKKLVESKSRNKMIAEIICSQRGHIHLVGSRQLKHLDAIRDACLEQGWPEEHIWMLRGEENARGESQAIVQAVQESHEGIIFSTVADEGLDVPPIDRMWQVFPVRAEHVVIQYDGRGERSWPGKKECVLYDILDAGCTVFDEQNEARQRIYRMQGYPIFEYGHDHDHGQGSSDQPSESEGETPSENGSTATVEPSEPDEEPAGEVMLG